MLKAYRCTLAKENGPSVGDAGAIGDCAWEGTSDDSDVGS